MPHKYTRLLLKAITDSDENFYTLDPVSQKICEAILVANKPLNIQKIISHSKMSNATFQLKKKELIKRNVIAVNKTFSNEKTSYFEPGGHLTMLLEKTAHLADDAALDAGKFVEFLTRTAKFKSTKQIGFLETRDLIVLMQTHEGDKIINKRILKETHPLLERPELSMTTLNKFQLIEDVPMLFGNVKNRCLSKKGRALARFIEKEFQRATTPLASRS